MPMTPPCSVSGVITSHKSPSAGDAASAFETLWRYADRNDLYRPLRTQGRAVANPWHHKPREGDSLILEAAVLHVRPGQSSDFEATFARAQSIISSMPGYIAHELHRCIEVRDKYLLLVRWRTVEDHETGFRKSVRYQEWKRLLHHFYDPFPLVEHFEKVQQG